MTFYLNFEFLAIDLHNFIIMKKILLISTLLFNSIGLFATEKNDLLKEIWSYYEKTINATKFSNNKSEIWSAILSVSSSECEKITKESETRGYIDSETKNSLIEKSISIEMIPVDSAYKIVYNIRYKYRYTADGIWLDGATERYKTKIKLKVYEALKGQLELTPELQTKVDEFNAAQTKSRKKIVKGDDY